MRRLVSLTVLLLLVCAGTAQAKLPNGKQVVAFQAAADYWAGRGEVVTCAKLEVWRTPDVERYTGVKEVAGVAILPCRVVIPTWVAEDSPLDEVCQVAAHEYGHLLGYGHTRDPRSLMNSDAWYIIPSTCRKAKKRISSRCAKRKTRRQRGSCSRRWGLEWRG